jgi:hypothetical protein
MVLGATSRMVIWLHQSRSSAWLVFFCQVTSSALGIDLGWTSR